MAGICIRPMCFVFFNSSFYQIFSSTMWSFPFLEFIGLIIPTLFLAFTFSNKIRSQFHKKLALKPTLKDDETKIFPPFFSFIVVRIIVTMFMLKNFDYFDEQFQTHYFGHVSLGIYYYLVLYPFEMLIMIIGFDKQSRLRNFLLLHHSLTFVFIFIVGFTSQTSHGGSWYMIYWEAHAILPYFNYVLLAFNLQPFKKLTCAIIVRVCSNLWCLLMYYKMVQEQWSLQVKLISVGGCFCFNLLSNYVTFEKYLWKKHIK